MASIIDDECAAAYPTERSVSAGQARRVAAEIRGANSPTSLKRKQLDPEARLERIWEAYFRSPIGSPRALQLLELLKSDALRRLMPGLEERS
jgi:hypothetical protein